MENTNKEFHTPDTTWSIFGCDSYEKYLELFLIRGKFHHGVPEDIVKAFNTVEYLIAHAYYYYPMYDEALVKVLRNIEMAVRMKCKALNIPTVNQNKLGKRIPVPYAQMIEAIHKREPQRDLAIDLESFKELRNSLLHPDRHSYMGGMSSAAIIRSINLVNTLFAPLDFIELRNAMFLDLKGLLSHLEGKILELDMGLDEIHVLHRFELTDVMPYRDGVILCLFIEPVPRWESYENKDQGFLPGFSFYLTDIDIEPNQVVATNTSDGSKVILTECMNDEYKKCASQYLEYLKQNYQSPFDSISSFISNTKFKAVAEFRLKQYHAIAMDPDRKNESTDGVK